MESESCAPSVEAEFVDAELGDRRLTRRLLMLASALAASPGKSLPQATGDRSQCEAAYRLLNNPRVTADAISTPHVQRTVFRASEAQVAVVVHDTTELEFSTDREGLGYLRKDDHGFLLHCSLVVAGDGSRRPMGVIATETWVRTGPAKRKTPETNLERATRADKESERWLRQMIASEERVGSAASLVHVADREADAFLLMARACQRSSRFVVRMARDRAVRDLFDEEKGHARQLLRDRGEIQLEMEVPLSRREAKGPLPRPSLLPRDARSARLTVKSTALELRKPSYIHEDVPQWLEVNAVLVYEPAPPDGEPPVEWVLFTTEPIETPEQVEAVVRYYRTRWVIEELFKGLKTGCQFEKLQLESYDALRNALAIMLPIAWRMLLMRALVRATPDAPAETVLSPIELAALRGVSSKKLGPKPTAKEVLIAIAVLGGYLGHGRNPKPPGWLVLARGFDQLVLIARGYALARALAEPDVWDP